MAENTVARQHLSDDVNSMANFASDGKSADSIPSFQQDGLDVSAKHKTPSFDDPAQFNMFNQSRMNPNFPGPFYPGMYPYPPHQGMFPSDYERNFSTNFYDRDRWLGANRFPGPSLNGNHQWPPPVSGSSTDEWMSADGRGQSGVPPWMGGMPPFCPPVPGSQFQMNRFDLGAFPNNMPYPSKSMNNSNDPSTSLTSLNSPMISQSTRFNVPSESQTSVHDASNGHFSGNNRLFTDSNNESLFAKQDGGNDGSSSRNVTTGDFMSGDSTQQKLPDTPAAKKKKKRKKPAHEDPPDVPAAEPVPPKKPKKSKKKKTDKPPEDSGASNGNNTNENSAATGADKPAKPKKSRKKKPKSDGAESAEGKKTAEALRKEAIRKKFYERRNIRTIKESETLTSETKDAQKEEQERLRRLEERKEMHIQQQNEQATSELKSLLECEDISEAKDDDVILLDDSSSQQKKSQEEKKVDDTVLKASASKDVVEISSSEDEDEEKKKKKPLELGHKTLEDLMKDTSTKDVKEEEDEGPDDPDNSGSHVNDLLNVPDGMGRVLVNTGHPPDEQDIYLAPQIAAMIKPHQIGGIRFLYDNLVESLNRFKSNSGFGCILAHSMGLGKTVQVISFIDIFLRYTGAHSVLVIVPVNTLQNWVSEFNMWLPKQDDIPEEIPATELMARTFELFVVSDSCRSQVARANIVDKWSKNGGVLIVGYEMFRLLTTKVTVIRPKRSRKKNPEPVVIDVEEEEKTKELLKRSYEALIKPGPDLVICDEGHRIKNCHAGISRALKDIRTKRRVVMTGYPLQNNLQEYWCMVDFVRPNFLGSRLEFSNMFERPIMNGQCVDSTPTDIKLMRYRAHVLHSLLMGFVQRRSHTVLQYTLPPKDEYVLLLRMSTIQRKLYNEFIHMIEDQSVAMWASKNPIKAFAVCCKIWNHPDIIYKVLKDDKKVGISIDNDLDIDEVEACANKLKKGGKKGGDAKDGDEETGDDASVMAEEEEDLDGFKKPFPACPSSILPQVPSSSKFSDSDTESILDLSMLRDADMDMPDLDDKMSTSGEERSVDGMLFCDDQLDSPKKDGSKVSPSDNSVEKDVEKTSAKVTALKIENKELETKKVLWSLNGDDSNSESKSDTFNDILSVKSEAAISSIKVDNKVSESDIKSEIKLEKEDGNAIERTQMKSVFDVADIKKPILGKTENHSLMHLLSDDATDEAGSADNSQSTVAVPKPVNTLRSASCPSMPLAATTAGGVKPAARPGMASCMTLDEAGKSPVAGTEKKMQNVISYDWATELLKDYKEGLLECGPKVAFLKHLLEESVLVGDKMLVFSQSLYTLSLIEDFLAKWQVPGKDYNWAKNKSYFRLDGGTSTTEREKMINQFNDAQNDRVLLFLLSTRAGSLGINLIGANRVVIFDASWNPCHDAQAVCRVYRYGQYKHCYIYRLVADSTMEKKIYDRQVNKEGISNRVVDELNTTHYFTKRQVDLLNFEEKDQTSVENCNWSEKFNDPILCKVLEADFQWLSVLPFKHESLLTERLEERLSKAEKRKAREGYEMEKRMGMAGVRPNAGGYRTIGAVPSMMLGVGGRMNTFSRPVASIRPMMSTPVPVGNRPVSVRPDVVVQQIHTTTDIIIPSSSGGDGVKKIPAGEKVILIKTPKGVYMRTNEGKIYAVRTAGKTATTSPADSAASSSAAVVASASMMTSSSSSISSMSASASSVSISKPMGVTSVTKVDNASAAQFAKKVTDASGATVAKTTLPSGAIVLRMPVPSNGPGVRLQGASLVHSTMGKRTVSVYKISSTTATTLNLANCIKASSKMGAMRPTASSTTVSSVKALTKESDSIIDDNEETVDDAALSNDVSLTDAQDKTAIGKNEMWKNKKMVSIAPVTVNRVVTTMTASGVTPSVTVGDQMAAGSDGLTGLTSLLTSSGGTVRSVVPSSPFPQSVGNWQKTLDICMDNSSASGGLTTTASVNNGSVQAVVESSSRDKTSPVKLETLTTKVSPTKSANSEAAVNVGDQSVQMQSAGEEQMAQAKPKRKRPPKKKKEKQEPEETAASQVLQNLPKPAAKPRKRSPKKPTAGTTSAATKTDNIIGDSSNSTGSNQMQPWQQQQQQHQQQVWPNQQTQMPMASPQGQGGGVNHQQQQMQTNPMMSSRQFAPQQQNDAPSDQDTRTRLGSWSQQSGAISSGSMHSGGSSRIGDWQQQQQQQQHATDMQSSISSSGSMEMRQQQNAEKGPARSEFESVFSSLLQPDDYWGHDNQHNVGAWDPWTSPRTGQQQQQQQQQQPRSRPVTASEGWLKESASNTGSAWHQPTPGGHQHQTSSVIDLDNWQRQPSHLGGNNNVDNNSLARKPSTDTSQLSQSIDTAASRGGGDTSFSGNMSQFRAPDIAATFPGGGYPPPPTYDQRWPPYVPSGSSTNQMAAPPAPAPLGMPWQHPWMAPNVPTSYGTSPYNAYPPAPPYYGSFGSAPDYVGFGAANSSHQGMSYMNSNLPGYPGTPSHPYPPYGTPGYPWPPGRNGSSGD